MLTQPDIRVDWIEGDLVKHGVGAGLGGLALITAGAVDVEGGVPLLRHIGAVILLDITLALDLQPGYHLLASGKRGAILGIFIRGNLLRGGALYRLLKLVAVKL